MIRFCLALFFVTIVGTEGLRINSKCKKVIYEMGIAHTGDAPEVVTTSSVLACRKLCSSNAECVGVTYNKRTKMCQLLR